MPSKEYTEEERLEAWSKAEEWPGHDPKAIRLDPVNHSTRIDWEKYGKRENFGWLIDENGTARHHEYRLRDAIGKARESLQKKEELESEDARKKFKERAIKLGIPDAWTLLERMKRLEDQYAELAEKVKNINSPRR